MVGTLDLSQPRLVTGMDIKESRQQTTKDNNCLEFGGTLQSPSTFSVFETYSVNLKDLDHGRELGSGEYGDVFLTNLTVRAKFFKVRLPQDLASMVAACGYEPQYMC